MFLINGSTFNMGVVNYTVPLNNIEIWSLTNQTPIAHPFHIHDVQFFILDINGNPPPPELQGLNDVVLVPAGMGTVRFIAQFSDFANDSVPYMYHCHMLTHEDDGMMGQFLVVDQENELSEINTNTFALYPNPTEGAFSISTLNYSGELKIEVTDIAGKVIFRSTQNIEPNASTNIDLSNTANGVYIVNVSDPNETHSIRVIKK